MNAEGYPVRQDGAWIEVDIPLAWPESTPRFWAKYYDLIEYESRPGDAREGKFNSRKDGRGEPMKRGEDVWYCVDCEWNGKIADAQPGQPCPNCDGYNLTPAFPANRVHGDRYQYYNGSTHWQKVANAHMKETAHANFLRSRRP